jgi:hypothetical protein
MEIINMEQRKEREMEEGDDKARELLRPPRGFEITHPH